MSRFVNRKSIFSLLVVLALVVGFSAGISLRGGSLGHAASLKYSSLAEFVKYMNSIHKAPFDRDGAVIPPSASKTLAKRASNSGITNTSGTATNVMVNQDRNPWPKAELGAAVDPTSGNNYVVMANDFRENWDHEFYHVSTNGGKKWTDDSMVGGSDPVTGFVPLTFQSDPGVAFDSVGHSYISAITGNSIFDFTNFYENFDTEIEVAQGFAHGRYTSLIPTPIDDQPCYGTATSFYCPAQLDKPFVTIDNVAGSPNKGSIYVYYTLFCNGAGPSGTDPCTDGTATVPAFSSAILVSSSAGAGLPFSAPALVSGSLTQEQFSDMVIDSHGTPHIFFDDFSTASVNMYESTWSGGSWNITSTPVASFTFNGLNNLNWGFRDAGTVAPGCGIGGDTAYCAFSAQQIGTGPTESTPSVYVAKVNTLTGSSTISRVNNDPFNDGKDHFFPWATVTANGVYVGWYDDRQDNFNTKVNYYVGKSTNGGATFPTQKAVSDTSSNPCVGFPGCGFFGDYVQLVSGPDNVVHAAWSDTRDGASMQIWSQAVTW
ncbi:MAG: hypothetical protein ACXVCM_08890 [Ktedonobacteraceae bacterium]